MTLTANHLKVKALRALEAVAVSIRRAPLPPSLMLGFTLAYLFSTAHPRDRRWFDEFWRAVTRPDDPQRSPYVQAVERRQAATAALNAIYRLVGVERTAAMMFITKGRTDDDADARGDARREEAPAALSPDDVSEADRAVAPDDRRRQG